MKKYFAKEGIIFGIGMTVWFLIQNLFIINDYTLKIISKAAIGSIVGGLVAGILFGFIIGIFKSSTLFTKSTAIVTLPDEKIIFSTTANHKVKLEAVGGRLYLTNKRIVFKSHKLNFQNHTFSIAIDDIENIERFKNLFIINNGLKITTKDYNENKFVVDKAAEWVSFLKIIS